MLKGLFSRRGRKLYKLIQRAQNGATIDLDQDDLLAGTEEIKIFRDVRLVSKNNFQLRMPIVIWRSAATVSFEGVHIANKISGIDSGVTRFVNCSFGKFDDDKCILQFSNLGLRGGSQCTVEVSKSTFHNLRRGISASNGARLAITDCQFDGIKGMAISVSGNDTRADISKSNFKSTQFGAVWAILGAEVAIRTCSFESINKGAVWIVQRSRGQVSESTFKDVADYAIRSANGSHVAITKSDFTSIGQAAVTLGSNAQADVSNCAFRDLRGHGISAMDGAQATLAECDFESIEKTAIYIDGMGTRGIVSKSRFRALSANAVEGDNGGVVEINDCSFDQEPVQSNDNGVIVVDGKDISATPPTVLTSTEPVSSNVLQELDAMIGLEKVKSDVHTLVALAEAERKRREAGLPATDLSLHLIFTGNPGTGKTTVARLLGEIYRELGLLKRGHVVEVDRGGLVGPFIGQTAPKTLQKISEALDGVLFIDEAHRLWVPDSPNDYGSEAITTLLKAMEDYRSQLVVVLAGYSTEMRRFIEADPGLKSRFTRYIAFEDYSVSELDSIFQVIAEKAKVRLSDEAKNALAFVIKEMVRTKDEHFGNARDVRTLYQKVIERQANRLQVDRSADPALLEVNDIPPASEGRRENLDRYCAELESLIGLSTVKQEVKRLVNVAIANEKRVARELAPLPISLHMVFMGNPGTGKTTVARLMGKIFAALGLLRSGHLIEKDQSGLVAGVVGQTAIKTQGVIKDSLDGVLFIDEAYALAQDGTRGFGQEAITTLLKEMEDKRDRLAVIVAGYTEEMKHFIASNPGLKSRFTRYLDFEDYSPSELSQIFVRFATSQSLRIESDALEKVKALCERMYKTRGHDFGNGRAVRQLFESAIENQAMRIVANEMADVTEVQAEDIPS
jgi:SpoVK/Ycf46/Vps4 family AAA+-type ATPase